MNEQLSVIINDEPVVIQFFTAQEWGPDLTKVDPRVVVLLNDIRAFARVPVWIHCSFDPSGHSSKSYHKTFPDRPLACAVDFHFGVDRSTGRTLSYTDQYALLNLFPEIGGMGFYPGWNTPGWHIDMRPVDTNSGRRLVWVKKGKKYLYDHTELALTVCHMDGLLAMQ